MAQEEAKDGLNLQKALRKQNKRLSEAGLAHVVEVPDPMKVLYREGFKTVCARDDAREVDYEGTIAGGRSVAFEAKRCSQKRFSFSLLEGRRYGDKEDLPRSQWQREFLRRHAAMGAVSFIFVRRPLDTIRWRDYLFPVEPDGTIAHTDHRRSIAWDDATPYAVARSQTWLDKAVEFWDLELPPPDARTPLIAPEQYPDERT